MELAEILAWLGGGAALAAGVSAWIGSLVAKRIIYGWEQKHEHELEKLKAGWEHDRSVLTAVVQSQSAGQAAATERRLVAVEALWADVRKLRSAASFPLFLNDILLPEEYNSALDNPTLSEGLNHLSDEDLHDINTQTDELELHRPFLGERLWLLFRTYRAFLGRLTFKMIEGRDLRDIKDWREDSYTLQLLNTVLTEREIDAAMQAAVRSARIISDQLESRMIDAMKKVVSGEAEAEASFQHAIRVRTLLSQIDQS